MAKRMKSVSPKARKDRRGKGLTLVVSVDVLRIRRGLPVLGKSGPHKDRRRPARVNVRNGKMGGWSKE